MKYLMDYKTFEVRTPNFARFKGNIEVFKDYLDKEYDFDTKFITDVYLIDDNKMVNIEWNHRDDHNLKIKLKERSGGIPVADFNDILWKVIEDLFNKHTNEFRKDYIKYDLYLSESKLHILVKMDYYDLFEENPKIKIVTILPQPPEYYDNLIEFPY